MKDPKDYSLAELLDAARHVNRDKWPQRAIDLDREIMRRREVGEKMPRIFRGGAGWGQTVWDMSASYPAASLQFTDTWLVLSVPAVTTTGEFRLERKEVLAVREWRGLFLRGFQVVHEKAGSPPVLFFRVWRLRPIREALLASGWFVEPARPDPERFT